MANVNIRIEFEPDDYDRLRALVSHEQRTAATIIRRLVRDEYAKTFGKKRAPHVEPTRGQK